MNDNTYTHHNTTYGVYLHGTPRDDKRTSGLDMNYSIHPYRNVITNRRQVYNTAIKRKSHK